MRIYLIRHGKPEVDPGMCYGRTDLAVQAGEHARVLVECISDLPTDAPIFSSPLRRCSELATRIAASIGRTEVEYDPRLMEMYFGDWEMRRWDDIAHAEVDAWARDVVHARPGGGESVFEVAQRVHAFHTELQGRRVDAAIVVCHAGTMRLLTRCVRGEAPLDMARAAAAAPHTIAYGELAILDCQSDNLG